MTGISWPVILPGPQDWDGCRFSADGNDRSDVRDGGLAMAVEARDLPINEQ